MSLCLQTYKGRFDHKTLRWRGICYGPMSLHLFVTNQCSITTANIIYRHANNAAQ